MTDTQQQKILTRVRGLLAKAASTEFEGERQAFLEKADQLMTSYAITEAMLRLKDDPNARLVERRDMSVQWFWDLLSSNIDRDAANSIYWLWQACVRHCRCVTAGPANWVRTDDDKEPVFGTPSDLNYLDMLFTDLFLQLAGKLRPTYDPSAEIGSQVRIAKEAGMTWDQILDWTGLRNDPLGKRLLPAYNKYCEAHGLKQVKISPKTYQYSFVTAFNEAVRGRMYQMRVARGREGNDGGDGTSTALVLRNIEDQARDAMYDAFPDMRPHPSGCSCADCKRKNRISRRSRVVSGQAQAQGHAAGREARIASNDGQVSGSRKQLT